MNTTPISAAPSSPAPWARLVCDPSAANGVDEISETISLVFDALSHGGPAELDFASLPDSPLHPEHLAAALRVSYASRQEIPSWHGALARCIDECSRGGIDARDALFGLL